MIRHSLISWCQIRCRFFSNTTMKATDFVKLLRSYLKYNGNNKFTFKLSSSITLGFLDYTRITLVIGKKIMEECIFEFDDGGSLI